MASRKQRKRRKRRPPAASVAAQESEPAPAPAGAAAHRPGRRRATGAEERPQPLWGSFPLSEIVVAIGLLLLLGGLFLPPDRGKLVIGVGLVLAALAGLELSAREHFAGYRSHTSLLAGGSGVAMIAAVLAVGGESLPVWTALAIGVGTGAAAAAALIAAFRRASGGASFRLR